MILSVIELIYVILLPLFLYICHRRRTGAAVIPSITGFLTYMVVSWIRALFRTLIVSDGSISAVVWSAVLSGVLEEVGRHVAFSKVIEGSSEPRDAISYGIGHGGCEIVLSTGMIMLNEFITAVETSTQLTSTLIPTVLFTMSGMLFHISLSMLVFISVHYRESKRYFPVAIGIHIAADIIGGLSAGNFALMFLTELLVSVALVLYTRYVYKKNAVP